MSNSLDLIRSVAKYEQCQRLHGSQQAKKPKEYNKVPEKVGNLDKNGEVISALTFVSPLAYKVVINLSGERVTEDMIQNMDPNLRITRGMYMIKYVPKTSREYRKGRHFIIGQDIIRMGIHIAGVEHFHKLCDRIPELNWIRHNTHYEDGLFRIAALQTNIPIWFSIDWCGYAKKLEALPGLEFGSKQGVGSAPFASYKCSAKEYREHYKDKCATLRTLHDVLKEVQEAEELPSVQKEMLESSGETGMTREQYIKGRGGVHQPKDPVTGRFMKKNKEEE